MKLKTQDLIGPALNWAVEKALDTQGKPLDWVPDPYSTSWQEGGPIIEGEGISITNPGGYWHASYIRFDPDTNCHWDEYPHHGPTPLIAAMRCFVASRLGDEVDIPEGLA
jgi:hypothetical protein